MFWGWSEYESEYVGEHGRYNPLQQTLVVSFSNLEHEFVETVENSESTYVDGGAPLR